MGRSVGLGPASFAPRRGRGTGEEAVALEAHPGWACPPAKQEGGREGGGGTAVAGLGGS